MRITQHKDVSRWPDFRVSPFLVYRSTLFNAAIIGKPVSSPMTISDFIATAYAKPHSGMDVQCMPMLMTNHVHLLVTPSDVEALSRCMQHIGRRYVQYFNVSYRRTGTLWEGRYKASLVDAESYLLTCYRYIELNPVRAGMVRKPGEYAWSSHRANALGRVDSAVTPHPLFLQLGSSDDERHRNYRELFEAHIDATTLRTIRDSLNQEIVVGNDRFRYEIEMALNRRTKPGRRGRPSKPKRELTGEIQ